MAGKDNSLASASITTPDVQPKPKTGKVPLNELGIEKGSSGTKLFGGMIYEEYNPKLQGLRGLTVYEEMRRSDAQIQATLLAMELPIRSTLWYVEAGETNAEGGEKEITDQDYEIAAFVEEALFARMEITFDEFLRQTLTMLPFWFSIFEKVYKEEGGKIYVKKLAQRLARTVWQWNRNDSGRPGITQFVPMNDEAKPSNIELPAEKILVFTFRKEGENFEGVSVLRSAYKHWYIKDTLYKLDAVKHERQAIGIPVISMPDTHTDEDEIEAETILANLRATEKSYVVLPGEKWKFEFANMGSGTTSDTEKSINHHNREIAKNILAQFLELWASGGSGSYALSEDQSSLFMLSLTAIAKQIAEKLNRELIPELVDMNFDISENQSYPKICFNKLGEVDYSKLSTALATLASGGMITPDEDLEDHLRKVFDLPKKLEEEEGTEEEDPEAMPEDGDTVEMDQDAEDMATEEEAAEETTDATPEEEAANADAELSKLEDELKSLEASELSHVAETLGGSFSENEIGAALFRAPVDSETKKKISEALQEYWKRMGKKTPDDLKKAGDSAKTRADNAKAKIQETTDGFKTAIGPLKAKLDEIRKLKESIPAGKRDPKKRAEIRDMARSIREEIKKIKSEKDANVTGLRSIRSEAISTAKNVKAEISKRAKAIEGVVSRIREDVKAKNATRSESIRSLADQVRANAESIRSVYSQAKDKTAGMKGKEKAAIMKNAKSLADSIRKENETLRKTARSLRDDSRKDRDSALSKADAIREAAGMKKKYSTEEAQALGFSDPDDMAAFLETKHLFDPRIILNVQSHG